MPLFAIQNVLNGGEIAPQLAARFDQPRYQTGARLMRNCLPMSQGGVTKRPGLVFCGLAAEQGATGVRLIPFVFSATQGRMLEFSPGKMRVWMPDGRLLAAPGDATRPYELTLPYGKDDLAELSFAQSADVVFLASRNHPPRKLMRYGDTDWRLAELTFLPQIAAPGQPTATPTGDVGSGNKDNVTYSYVVTAIDKDSGQESYPSASVSATCASLSQSWFITLSWPGVSNAAEYRVYKKKGGVFGCIGRAEGTNFEDKNLGADAEDTPQKHRNPFAQGNYPGLVFLHQQRLGFAASPKNPLTVWMTRAGDLECFSASSPPKDDDAIEASLAANQANRILWACPDRNTLALGTEGGEWALSAREGNVLTPTNLSFEPQTANGSAPGLHALRTGSGLLYVQRGGGVVREFGYSFQDDRYTSQDLTLLARHMLQDRNVVSWAYQQEPFSVIWCALSDGSLAGLTYMREHDVIGWHRHDTDGVVEQIAGLPGTPDDALWCVVRRERVRDGGREQVRTVERLAPFFDSPDRETAFFVDGGLSYVGPEAQEFGGLEHLEGREVAVFCDGYVHPPRLVRQGSIRLERPVRVAHVGLPYAGELSPTLPEAATQQGNTLLKIRKITALKLRLYRSMNLYAGLNGRAAQPLSAHKITGGSISPTPWWAERADVSLVLGGGWEEEAELLLRMPDPTPATLLALVTTVDMAPLAGSQE